ncbi:MAG: dTDP-4-dehydrorhamnose reductase [Planctomycetota bacterium]|jgi:dTDP-4-dehydrorhamnose reductase
MADRVAILGGKGMLGSDLARVCSSQGIDYEIFDLPEFDITKQDHIEKVARNSELIINCAAYTNVENAQSEAEVAYKVNAEAVGNLGKTGKESGAWIMHISTDFVFDGTLDRPYVETDQTNPINIYGKSKLAGEQLFIESKCQGCIIRIEWTYGMNGNNFVKKLIERAKAAGQLQVVDDQVGSPTATTEVAGVICQLLRKKPQGLYHFANSGYVSRYDMAKFIFEKLGMNVKLDRCKTKDFLSKAERPLNSCFSCDKIATFLDEPIQHWQKPLEIFLKQL